ncbi:MAG: SpoIIIAH-like family protein [Clostridiales bacterium]|jgi:hypothetical protein|nr:SpoIIIAH-like family protein [Clostridiales bacterium]
MLGKKGKIFVLAGMVALLVATGVLNIVLNYTAKGDAPPADGAVVDFFADFRANRESTRAELILGCEVIINDGTSSAEAIAAAEEARQFYINAPEMERELEALIKAVGFADAVVTTSTTNVNIILRTPELTSEEVGRVLEIVTAETGKKANNIRIIPIA